MLQILICEMSMSIVAIVDVEIENLNVKLTPHDPIAQRNIRGNIPDDLIFIVQKTQDVIPVMKVIKIFNYLELLFGKAIAKKRRAYLISANDAEDACDDHQKLLSIVIAQYDINHTTYDPYIK